MKNLTVAKGTPRSVASVAAVKLIKATFVLSVLALIVSVVFYIIARVKDPVYTSTYAEIPAILCDYRRYDDDTSQYIYYYGVKNPGKITTESLYADTDGESKALPQNLGNVMDIYNWELQGNRQWLCLYQTRDIEAGRPVLVDSIRMDGNEYVDGMVGLNHFGGDNMSTAGYSLTSPYNKSMISIYKENMKKSPLYIHYNVDTKAKYTQSAEEKIISTFLGAMFTTGSGWAMAGFGIAVGVIVGVIVDKKASKVKRDAE